MQKKIKPLTVKIPHVLEFFKLIYIYFIFFLSVERQVPSIEKETQLVIKKI